MTATFLTQGGSDSGSEIVLLLAASVATVLTAAVASPFEVLRVRSMGLIEPQKWTDVLQDFMVRSLCFDTWTFFRSFLILFTFSVERRTKVAAILASLAWAKILTSGV